MGEELNIHQFFVICRQKPGFRYMSKEAHCFWDEDSKCFGITQVDDGCYESIQEDQVEAIYMLNSLEFLIIAKNGEESILSYPLSHLPKMDWLEDWIDKTGNRWGISFLHRFFLWKRRIFFLTFSFFWCILALLWKTPLKISSLVPSRTESSE